MSGNGRDGVESNGGGSDGPGSNGSGSKKASPLHVWEQNGPEPERPQSPAEEAGMAPHQRDDPPQSEGDRDDDEEEPGEAGSSDAGGSR